MEFSPDNSITWFINGNCFDGTLSSILKKFSIIEAEAITFANPVFSKLKRNNFCSLHISLFIRNIFSLGLFFKLYFELYLSLLIIIILIANFEFSGIELFMMFQKILDLLFKFISFSFFYDSVSDSIFFYLFLFIFERLYLLFKTIYLS